MPGLEKKAYQASLTMLNTCDPPVKGTHSIHSSGSVKNNALFHSSSIKTIVLLRSQKEATHNHEAEFTVFNKK